MHKNESSAYWNKCWMFSKNKTFVVIIDVHENVFEVVSVWIARLEWTRRETFNLMIVASYNNVLKIIICDSKLCRHIVKHEEFTKDSY